MARTCSACGHANNDDANFCQRCGAPLAAPVPPAAAPQPAATEGTGPAPGPVAPPPAGTPMQPPATEAPAVGGPPPGNAGGGPPPRRGKPAPRWLVVLISVAAIALVCVLAFVLIPRGGSDGDGGETTSPAPSAGATLGVSPTSHIDEYLAGAVGAKADRLAAILADGTFSPITRFSGQQIWQIAYSPNGQWLACVAGSYKRSELWLFDTSSGDARQATADAPSIVAVDSIAWLSDGDLLVAGYTQTPKATGQNANLLVYGVETRAFSALANGSGVALHGISTSASRDGTKIAYVTFADRQTDKYGMASAKERLVLLDRGSGTTTRLGENEAYFDVNARAFDEPLLSPSGTAIIFRRAGSDVGTSYTVLSADGTVLMAAKETQFPAGYAWDPDGTKVVFTGHSLKQAANDSGIGPAIFWVFDTVSRSTRVIARYQDTMVQDLSWSPDGESIAWAEYDQKKYKTGTVFVMPADGGDSKTLAKQALSPVWAPGAGGALQTAPSP